jgi:hypothetical protein
MIERDSLATNAPTTAAQQGVSGVPIVQQEASQELARAIVREAGLAREDVGQQENDKACAEEIQRRDLIIGQLTQANAALAARVPELEAPQTSEDGTQEPVEDAGRGKTGRGGCYGLSERVPWWRRVLGEGRLWTQRREIASCALGRLKKGSARFSG